MGTLEDRLAELADLDRAFNEKGIIVPGNIDLNNRPIVQNPDGTVSTERSISIGTPRGEILIPTVIQGKVVSKDAAIKHYNNTGEHLGVFKDVESATSYADLIHNRSNQKNMILSKN